MLLLKTYKELNKEEFYNLAVTEQVEIINDGLKEGATLQDICNTMGVDRKHLSEKFRKKEGYNFIKQGEYKQFIKNEDLENGLDVLEAPNLNKEEIEDIKPAEQIKESIKRAVVKNNLEENIKPTKNKKVVCSFDLYYQPTGQQKKMGASVDIEVLREFEKLCNRLNYVNTSTHVTNALALYIQEQNSK